MADLRPQITSDLQYLHNLFQRCAPTVPDAKTMWDRLNSNDINESGHAHSVPALAVLYAQTHPNDLPTIAAETDLSHSMTTGSSEAHNDDLWDPIKAKMQTLIQSHSADLIVDQKGSPGTPQSADDLRSYLSPAFGGTRTAKPGGKGDTNFKRPLKLIAHCGLPSLGNTRNCC